MNKNEIRMKLDLHGKNKSYFNDIYTLLKDEIKEQESINADINKNDYLFHLKQTLEKQAKDFRLNGTTKNYIDFIENFDDDIAYKIDIT